MELVLNQEQEDLRTSVRTFFQAESPMSRVRAVVDGERDHDPALWRRMTGELGLAGLAVPDTHGGMGAGQVERSVVLEEMGRALAPGPYLSTAVLAADTLLALDDDDARAELLPSIAAGDVLATVAVAEERGTWSLDVATTARRDGGSWVVDGRKGPVLDGAGAGLALVLAGSPEGPAFFAVDLGGPGVTRTPLAGLDPTRRFARLDFARAPARRLACDDVGAALARIVDLASVALASESVGVLARAMELAVDYALVRVQFGRFIGSYQAVKHQCVDSYVDWELAYSVVRHAAWAAEHSPDELPLAAAHARTFVLPAAFAVAARTIEVHGGIGFTWEHDAHLYYKRAKSSELFLGDGAAAHASLADRLGV